MSSFDSYVQLAQGLLGTLSGACLLDCHGRLRGASGAIDLPRLRQWIEALDWNGTEARRPASVAHTPGQWLTAVPLEQSDTRLLGVFLVQQPLPILPSYPARHAVEVAKILKPVLDCVHRELAAELPLRERVRIMTERTAELEWLFRLTGSIGKDAADDRHALRELLAAATTRLDSALGVCEIPAKRMCIDYSPPASGDAPEDGWGGRRALLGVWQQTRQHLINWAMRRKSPLMINSSGRTADAVPRCKILAVPVVRDNGCIIGVLAFFNPPFAEDYAGRHVYLAKHLGLQAATVVDLQFDLMTGLYTRDALAQTYGARLGSIAAETHSLVYLDVDHMQQVNEVCGFEIGNELLVRIADLLGPPLLPSSALAARLSADRFAVVLPQLAAADAAQLARAVCDAAVRLVIGTSGQEAGVSLSCGVAELVPLPQGLERGIAAAEVACKAAKRHGGNRVEIYRSDDGSMMRRQRDAIAVGELRAALQADRLVLQAERMKPLQDPSLPGAYEILPRLRDSAGGVRDLGPLWDAARRYRVLPSLDRWLMRRTLAVLGAYRGMLKSRGLGVFMPVSEQSLADPSFATFLGAALAAAKLPAGCVTLHFDAAAAMQSLARAKELNLALRRSGCQFALHGFSMGRDSLLHIRELGITRIKLDAALVEALPDSVAAAAAVGSIVEFARSQRLATVADGGGDAARLRLLHALGIDYVLGAVGDAAEPVEEVLRALAADESRRLSRLYLEL